MAVIAFVAGLPATRRGEALARAVARLAPRAPRGEGRHDDSAWSAWYGAVHPAEAGAAGAPLALAGRHALLFDGWLRNAVDLAGHLGLPRDTAPAALVLGLLRREGVEGLSRLRGFHALAWIAPDAVWLARDPGGQRPLAWRLADDVLYLASSELAVLDAARITAEPQPTAVAAFAAGQAPPPGMSFLRGVDEVPPGCVVRLDARGASTRAAGWRPSPRAAPRDAVGAWRDALQAAVRDALDAGAGTAAISLSGGLDSAALAALAAGAPRPPVAVSWRLPGVPLADESPWIDATAAAAGLAQATVDGSALAPLAHGAPFPLQLESPLANPYRPLKQALWDGARAAGADVLLSGHYGDHVYPGEREWLRAAWRAGRHGAALVELARRARRSLPWRDPGVRAALRPLLHADPDATTPPDWLGPAARAAWTPPVAWPQAAAATADPLRCRTLLGLEAALDAAHETGFADRAGLRLLHPYRDERVIELALSIPVERFARGGVPKALTREALAGRLPDAVRLRPKSGSLVPFLRRGLRAPDAPLARLLDAPGARWLHWLDEARVRAAWRADAPDEADDLLLWRAASLEMWFRGLADGPPVLASWA
jgi:asparagine synthase (glutamine-hydrolysing)